MFQESETLANRLIEGQILNAQYAEESYQLKRENCTLKKQLDDPERSPSIDQKPSSFEDSHRFYQELETLRETINRLTLVEFLRISSMISSDSLLGKSSITICTSIRNR